MMDLIVGTNAVRVTQGQVECKAGRDGHDFSANHRKRCVVADHDELVAIGHQAQSALPHLSFKAFAPDLAVNIADLPPDDANAVPILD